MSLWIASLPMYNVTPQHAVSWRSLLSDCVDAFARAAGPAEVAIVDATDGELLQHWGRNDLLLSQTCGFPYRMLGVASAVHLIATRPAAKARAIAARSSFRRKRGSAARRPWPHAVDYAPPAIAPIRTAE